MDKEKLTEDQKILGKFLQKGMDEMLGFHAPLCKLEKIDGFFVEDHEPFFVIAYVNNIKYKYDGKVMTIN